MWRLTVDVAAEAAWTYADALEPLASSVAVLDGGGEPGRSARAAAISWANDVWFAGRCTVEALFADPPDEAAVAAALMRASVGLVPPHRIEALGERDWVAETNALSGPVRVGRFVLLPVDAPAPPGGLPIRIAGTTAFGTGRHETTQGCLLALDGLARRGLRPRRILDVGTGTGVLAAGALRLWPGLPRGGVVAGDLDPEAVRCAETNLAANGLARRAVVVRAAGLDHRLLRGGEPADLVLANILARPLVALVPAVDRAVGRGGRVVLSGLLWWQEAEVFARYRAAGFVLERRIGRGDWTTLVLARPRGSH